VLAPRRRWLFLATGALCFLISGVLGLVGDVLMVGVVSVFIASGMLAAGAIVAYREARPQHPSQREQSDRFSHEG
jgi:hypothetical protein